MISNIIIHQLHTSEQIIWKIVQRRRFVVIALVRLVVAIVFARVVFGACPLIPLPLFLAQGKRSVDGLLNRLQNYQRYIRNVIRHIQFILICVCARSRKNKMLFSLQNIADVNLWASPTHIFFLEQKFQTYIVEARIYEIIYPWACISTRRLTNTYSYEAFALWYCSTSTTTSITSVETAIPNSTGRCL